MPLRLQKPALILAALLQLLPIARTLCTNPATASTFAFILRWGIGAGAVLGSVDAVSGATSVFTTPSTFSGTVGNYFSNNVTVSIGGGNKAAADDYFIVTAGAVSSPPLANNQSTTVGLPAGLTFKSSWVNNATTIGGVIYGTPTAAGTYPISVTCVSPGNAQLSQAITITISGSTGPTAPAITTPPVAATTKAGNNASFTVTASGTAPLGYFWLKNGNPLANAGNISGANTAALTIATTSTADAGNYSVIVSNSVGSDTSAPVALTIIVPPAITSQPVAQTVAAGSSAAFSVTATGSAPLAYRWLKNGTNITNGAKFSGVSSNVLTIATLAAADAGNYSVVITNLAGSITSSVAPLTVLVPPAITSQPVAQTLAAGGTATFSVTASGTAPLSYFWLKNGSPLANAGNVSGANTATLSITTISTADAANYSVIISNSVNTVTSAVVALTVLIPPAITTQPVAQTLAAGSTATFSVTASGTAPLTYFWLKNGSPLANAGNISGANTASLSIATISTADAANYSVIVSNSVSSVTSAAVALTVVSSPTITTPPANLSVAAGANASFTVVAAGSAPLTYQWLKNSSPLANGGNVSGATTATLNLTAVTSADAANYSVTVSNNLGGVTSAAATLTVAIPPAIVTSPADVTATAGSNVSFTVTASGTAPLTYQWFKNSAKISGATSATLALANISATDAASYYATVTNAVGNATSAAATLTVLGPPTITAQPVSATVVQGNPATFTVGISGTTPINLQWLLNGVAIPGATSNVLTLASVSTNDAGNYSIVATNIVGGVASSSATLTVLVPPTIQTQPTDVTVTAGNPASFSVSASGTAPLTYQWRKNGGNIPGATSATLTFATTSATNAGTYSVVVTNAAGTITSGNAILTVQSAPSIITQPVSQFGALGSTINLSVTAIGTSPLNYQWFKGGAALADGANISGSTSNVLTIASLTTNEVDTYFVVVSNLLGSATSTNVFVSVNISPVITSSPASQTVAQNSQVILTVAATGSDPLTYQWLKNGVKVANGATISGATSATLTLANVQATSGGNYSVLVTNSYGSATSAAATLTVLATPVITTSPASRSAKAGATTTFAVTAKGGAPLSYQWFKNGVALTDGGNVSGSITSSLKIIALTTNDAAVYSVTVSNLVGSATSGNATLTLLGSVAKPVILAHPTNQSAVVSHDVEFGVQVNGTAPLSFQWRKGNKVIPGATNITLRLTNVKTNDAATYSVIVQNPAGKVISRPAKLTVWIPPLFAVQPVSRTSTNGMTTVFKTSVFGSKPITYQWFKNGVALTNGTRISGAQTAILTVKDLHRSDAGTYFLRASNIAGVLNSSNAVLTVRFAPRPGTDSMTTGATSQTIIGLPPLLQITAAPDGTITVTGTGTPGANYTLQTADSLAPSAIWTNFSTKTADAVGQWQVTDTNDGQHAARFYRVGPQ